ncbi:MAG TPA: carbon storage regulator, partial [Polyangiaceae bacterium]|nr:carbon storage regulator [Polyangiaceae bacterium]
MLVIARRRGQRIVIGGDIEIIIADATRRQVKIGIVAPKSTTILRGEIFDEIERANREALKSLGSWSAEMQVTIESADLLLVLRELRNDFVVTFANHRTAALGMVRLQVKRT